jgi:multiple sugar transport system permease protein
MSSATDTTSHASPTSHTSHTSRRTRPHDPRRVGAGTWIVAIVLALWVLVPIFLLTVNALSTEEVVNRYPRALLPDPVTFSNVQRFLDAQDVVGSIWISVKVAFVTLALCAVVGFPAGFAIANYAFRGQATYRLAIVSTRAFPPVILAVPLAYAFVKIGLDDSWFAVSLVHTAIALPFTILVSASVFAGVPRELQEAAGVFGAGPLRTFARIVAPLALPGLAAAMLFTFVTSWNEVFVSTILTLNNRTLPARTFLLLENSGIEVRFAGGFLLMVPSLVFMAFIRKYLFRLFGSTLK